MGEPGARAQRLTSGQVHELLDRSADALFRYRTVPPRGFEFVSGGIAAMVGYTPQDHYDDPDLGLRIVDPADQGVLAAAMAGQFERTRLTMRWRHRDGRI